MKKSRLRVFLQNLALLVLVLTVCSSHGFAAAIGPCATSEPGNSFNAPSGVSTNDCTDQDKTFTSFSVSSATCTTDAGCTTSTGANTFFSTAGTLTSGATAGFAGTITANLEGGTDDWRLTSGDSTDTATLNYDVLANVGAPAGAGLSWVIGGTVGLSLAGDIDIEDTGTTQTITVVDTFCINASATDTCSAANQGQLEAEITVTPTTGTGSDTTVTFLNCSAGANVGTCNGADDGIVLSQFVSEIAVSDTFTLSREIGADATLSISNIDNEFGEYAEGTATPEPATFALLGAGLLALGGARYRRKRS